MGLLSRGFLVARSEAARFLGEVRLRTARFLGEARPPLGAKRAGGGSQWRHPRAAMYIGLFIVGFFLLLYLSQGKSASRQAAIANADASIPPSQAELLQDPDNDGLPNWEEALLKTDPANPDTDGDGMSDGEETKANRDPLTPGVGDLKSRSENLVSSNGELTTELAKAVIDSGAIGEVLQGNSGDIPDSFLKNIGAIYTESQAKLVSENLQNLRYSPASDPASIKKYFNAVAASYLTNFSKFEKNDLEIFAVIAKNPTEENAKLLDPYIGAVNTLLNDLESLEAPLAVKEFHEKGVTLAAKTKFEVAALRNVENDPALALLASYNRVMTKIALTDFYDLQVWRWLKTQNIAFATEEAGHQMFGW